MEKTVIWQNYTYFFQICFNFGWEVFKFSCLRIRWEWDGGVVRLLDYTPSLNCLHVQDSPEPTQTYPDPARHWP